MAGWKRKGWRTAAGKPVLNQDLWKALDLVRLPDVPIIHVKGHSGDPDNERAVSWCKQTFDKVVGGQVVSKSREEYEPLIYPTTFIIQPVGVSSDIAFVESVKTFFDSDKENESTTNTQKITIP